MKSIQMNLVFQKFTESFIKEILLKMMLYIKNTCEPQYNIQQKTLKSNKELLKYLIFIPVYSFIYMKIKEKNL